jgi:hypothetical protein
MFILAGVFAPNLPTVGAAVAAGGLYAGLLAFAALLTAFPRVRDHVDRFCHDQLFDEQRASDLQAAGLLGRVRRRRHSVLCLGSRPTRTRSSPSTSSR